MTKPVSLKDRTEALIKQYGEDRFFGILTLSFFDAFPGAIGRKILPIPLFCFYSKKDSGLFHVYRNEGRGIIDEREGFCFGVADLLLGAVLSNIPVFISPMSSRMDYGEPGEDFLKVLFGVSPVPYFPKLMEQNNNPPPIIMDMNRVAETEMKILRRIERGETPFGARCPAIFLEDGRHKNKREEDKVKGDWGKKIFGLTIPSAAASDTLAFLVSGREENGFNDFLEDMAERACRYLEIDKKDLRDLDKQWPILYPELANYIRRNPVFLDSTMEWFDLVVTLFTDDYKSSFSQEAGILIHWVEKFEMGGIISFTKIEKEIYHNHVQELFNTFESGLTVDDAGRAYKLAPFFSLMNLTRSSITGINPVESYFENPHIVSIRDVFIPFFIILSERSKAPVMELADILNESVENYRALVNSLSGALRFDHAAVLEDPDISILHRAFRRAIMESLEGEGVVESMLEYLLSLNRELLNLFHPGAGLINLQIILSSADILTLAGFMEFYRKELNLIINCFAKESNVDDVIAGIKRFFEEKRRSDALVMPSIFQQRMPRILR